MVKNLIEEKVIKEASKYVWGRIKFILLMIILVIFVKNHPGWDTFFMVMIIFQSVLAVIWVLRIPKKVEEARKKEKDNHNFYGRFHKSRYDQKYRSGSGKVFTKAADISTSAKLLGINIVQDDEDTIKKKYRKLAMKWHPDRFATDTKENQEIAKRNFQKVSDAYEKIKQYKNIS